MLPKCHPELNPIEQFWAFTKSYTRQHCTYSFAALKQTVPKALKHVPLNTVRRYYRRASRFCKLYSIEKGTQLPWALRDFAMKKYTSHRGVPQTIGELVDALALDLTAKHHALTRRFHHPSKNRSQIKEEKISKVKNLIEVLEALKTPLPPVPPVVA